MLQTGGWEKVVARTWVQGIWREFTLLRTSMGRSWLNFSSVRVEGSTAFLIGGAICSIGAF